MKANEVGSVEEKFYTIWALFATAKGNPQRLGKVPHFQTTQHEAHEDLEHTGEAMGFTLDDEGNVVSVPIRDEFVVIDGREIEFFSMYFHTAHTTREECKKWGEGNKVSFLLDASEKCGREWKRSFTKTFRFNKDSPYEELRAFQFECVQSNSFAFQFRGRPLLLWKAMENVKSKYSDFDRDHWVPQSDVDPVQWLKEHMSDVKIRATDVKTVKRTWHEWHMDTLFTKHDVRGEGKGLGKKRQRDGEDQEPRKTGRYNLMTTVAEREEQPEQPEQPEMSYERAVAIAERALEYAEHTNEVLEALAKAGNVELLMKLAGKK